MPTCPHCGSIIMEGDPYCSHCEAILSWDDDNNRRETEIPSYMDPYDPAEELRKSEEKRQELLSMISDFYQVKLEDLDVKDTYTEYIFMRKTPYYTLRMVATDQYGNTIGIKRDETSVDFSGLLKNEKFKKLTENLEYRLTASLRRDEIGLKTEDAYYLLDTDNMKLILQKRLKKTEELEKYCVKCNRVYADMEYEYCPICKTELKTREKKG